MPSTSQPLLQGSLECFKKLFATAMVAINTNGESSY